MDSCKGNKEIYNVQSIKHQKGYAQDTTQDKCQHPIVLSLDLKDTWTQIICENPSSTEWTGRQLELINAQQFCARKVGEY